MSPTLSLAERTYPGIRGRRRRLLKYLGAQCKQLGRAALRRGSASVLPYQRESLGERVCFTPRCETKRQIIISAQRQRLVEPAQLFEQRAPSEYGRHARSCLET